MSKQFTITWQAEDIQSLRPTWSLDQCEAWLESYFYKMQDGMVEDGWNIINYFLTIDEVPCPENDGGFDCTPFCPSCEGNQFVKRESV